MRVEASGNAVEPDGNESSTYETPPTNRIFVADAELCDAAGNQVAGREPGGQIHRFYQHDAAGRLGRVMDYGDGHEPPPIVTEHIYGACRRRRASRAGDDGPVTYYVWSGDQVIAEYVDNDPDGAHDLRWTRHNFFLGERVVATRLRAETGVVDSELTYQHPGRAGTRFTTSSESDQDVLVWPYGTAEVVGDSRRVFTSYDRDPRTQLDYAVNRFYDHGTGRFLEPDPLSLLGFDHLDPMSFNAFTFGRDDPVNRIDPLGLVDCPPKMSGGDPRCTLPAEPITGRPPQAPQRRRVSSELDGLLHRPSMGSNGAISDPANVDSNTLSSRMGASVVGPSHLDVDALGLARYEWHHVLPQALGSWFRDRGIDIHNYTLRLIDAFHSLLHNRAGYDWNGQWKHFKDVNPTATVAEILKFAEQLRRDFGLDKVPYERYPGAKHAPDPSRFAGAGGESGGGGSTENY